MKVLQIIAFVMLFFWHMSANAFFGWNFLPQSVEEYIVDGLFIVGLIAFCGMAEK